MEFKSQVYENPFHTPLVLYKFPFESIENAINEFI